MTARQSIGAYVLSSGQRSLWTVYKYQPESPAYSIPVAFRLHGVLDTALLRLCLKLLYQRHESLRTRFREVDGDPCQFIEDVSLAVPVILVAEEKARERLAKENSRVFN